jgi:hypothetical protein
MEDRVARLEEDMQDVKSVLSRLEPMIVRIDATLTATLPNLATKAEVADLRAETSSGIADLRTGLTKEISDLRTGFTMETADLRSDLTEEIANLRNEMIQGFAKVPTKTYLWATLGVLITAYGAGLAALAAIR